jgi:hypothetical protein
MGMDIDEARSDDETACVDFSTGSATDVANRDDATLLDSYGTRVNWRPRTITNSSIFD